MKFFFTAERGLALGVLLAFAGAAAAQQAYPSKPIRFIIPFTPGGTTSVLARMLGQKMTESWGQPVIVDNRPGGNTIVGTEALAKSPPDGHTIVLVTSTHVINSNLVATPYDAIKDFAAVATVVSTEMMLVVNASVPANTLKEFIALAKSKPGQLNYATSASGGVTHLPGELFNMMTGVKLQQVPYKGSGPLMIDLVSGQVQLAFAIPFPPLPFIKTGKLRALAISGPKRLPALPQVPTFTEAGLPGFDIGYWYGVLAPARTPKPVVDKLSREIAKILAMPEVKEKFATQGLDAFISTPEQFAARMKADMAKYAKIIKAANIKFES